MHSWNTIYKGTNSLFYSKYIHKRFFETQYIREATRFLYSEYIHKCILETQYIWEATRFLYSEYIHKCILETQYIREATRSYTVSIFTNAFLKHNI